MHVDIDYAGLDPYDARQKALADAKDWLGDERYEKLSTLCRGMQFRDFVIAMSFAGIRGFPVKELYREWIDGSLTDAMAREIYDSL